MSLVEKQREFDALTKKANDLYLGQYDYKFVLEMLEHDDFLRYTELYKEIHGKLPEWLQDELDSRISFEGDFDEN